jgi:hypothetical protein
LENYLRIVQHNDRKSENQKSVNFSKSQFEQFIRLVEKDDSPQTIQCKNVNQRFHSNITHRIDRLSKIIEMNPLANNSPSKNH